ncbi:substrate-binding periplasmic protein [Bowmanella pacifica]|uniref:substrate-binding periplasmic protein n=1 Tax=Bowmanella pacifica TaxID=502051 RepID=UPI00166DD3C0|nr:transporter substrate-binding domain-containing protein [Bowmanella pacifica]
MRIGLILILCCWGCSLAAAERVVRVGLNFSAPWAYADEQGSLQGIDHDIVYQALSAAGYQVQIELFSHERMLQKFKQRELDFASPIAFDIPGAHKSLPYMEIQDVAASLSSAGLAIEQLDDLSDKRVVAYQKAIDVLGQPFANVLESQNYLEMVDRDRQFDLLFSGKVDVVVGDRLVLEYYSRKMYGEGKIRIHPIFASQVYPAAAWDPEIIKAFNQHLMRMQARGDIKLLMHSPRP